MLRCESVAVESDGAVLLHPISARLSAGACVAIRGANGAGKTTLLRVLAGRLRPSAGSATLFGAALDERDREVRLHVAALIEPPTLYPDLTLRDQLELIGAAWQGELGTAWAGMGGAALERFGLAELADRFPHELSSGQRQLVSLAVTFARPCSALLLDEPEQRLDPDRRELVAEAIGAVRDAGAAVAFASHDAQLVARVAHEQIEVNRA
ncbi:MAG: ATP-binding cassette domain-containing protein [Leucobacter sp.]